MSRDGGQPEMVFRGKCAPWFVAIMLLGAALFMGSGLFCFLCSETATQWRWLALLLVPTSAVLAALPIFNNRVELYADRIVIVYAMMRVTIPYSHVRGIRRTRSTLAGTANSLDRVFIEAPYDGDAIVSVGDNDALVAEIEHRCGLHEGADGEAAGRGARGGTMRPGWLTR